MRLDELFIELLPSPTLTKLFVKSSNQIKLIIYWHERAAFQSVGVRAVDWQ